MIYITGDTHGNINDYRFDWLRKNLTKDDTLIVLGDFGFYFYEDMIDTYNFNFTTVSILGNHCNYDILKTFPEVKVFNANCRKMKENVYIVNNGEMLTIEGKKFFCFGGAISIDKSARIPHLSWWPEEIPSLNEYNRALDVLEDNNYTFDYFLSHTAPKEIVDEFRYQYRINDPTETYLSQLMFIIKDNGGSFKHLYFGHHHKLVINENYSCLFEQIVREEDGEIVYL